MSPLVKMEQNTISGLARRSNRIDRAAWLPDVLGRLSFYAQQIGKTVMLPGFEGLWRIENFRIRLDFSGE
jgi:hypothetical protein